MNAWPQGDYEAESYKHGRETDCSTPRRKERPRINMVSLSTSRKTLLALMVHGGGAMTCDGNCEHRKGPHQVGGGWNA